MLKIKVYSTEKNPNTGGGYTYLQSILDALKQHTGLELQHHGPRMAANRLQQRLISLRRVFTDLQFDWILFKSNYIPAFSLNKYTILLVDFPFQKALGLTDRIKLNRIRYICCNSEYTASFIRQYWGREAHVLYPPCMDFSGVQGVKKKHILNVGRFVHSSRSKRQDVLIKAFIRLYQTGLTDYKLILAGFVQDQTWLNQLKAMSIGYPIEFYENADNTQIRKLYIDSAIYWHACGYEVNAKENPSLVEHYGIAVADAMAAGCVTMVHKSGGPAELVQAPTYGLAWESIEDLVALTKTIAEEPEQSQMKNYFSKARNRSEEFSSRAFNAKLQRIIQI